MIKTIIIDNLDKGSEDDIESLIWALQDQNVEFRTFAEVEECD